MNDVTIAAYAGCFLMALIGLYSFFIIRSQQKTIDKLTDKLMAKDYREYVSVQRPAEKTKPKREPMSWHDDPEIEDE